jgi:hypothetical protein
MNGAGVPLWATNAFGETYGYFKSGNFGKNNWTTWWGNGWNAANSGNLPKPVTQTNQCN